MENADAKLVELVEKLAVEDTTGQLAHESRRVCVANPLHLARPSYFQVQDAMQTLSKLPMPRVESIQRRFGYANPPITHLGISNNDVSLLRGGARELQEYINSIQTTIVTLNGVAECAVYERLKVLGNLSPGETSDQSMAEEIVEELLLGLGKQIKTIIRDVLDNTGDSNFALWRVAKECHKKATIHSGSLDADRYMDQRSKESRVAEDQYYTRGGLDYCVCWTGFWNRVIEKVPGGPTLFRPPGPMSLRDTDIPAYLFRTFDPGSSGMNNEEVVASRVSYHDTLQSDSRTDVLTFQPKGATIMLYQHLTKGVSGAEVDDNFMSWTSSLLFAIQYAIYRGQSRNPSEIKICVVDTPKFPRGQFARDTWLLEQYRETAMQLGGQFERFWRLRDGEDYYNGEYLSQGALNHANRSRLVSMEQLVDAGLCKLYPEFEDPNGTSEWAKRVKRLRWDWSGPQTTSDEEIQQALGLGCSLSPSEPLDMALMLLAFKNRKSRFSALAILKAPPGWAVKPVEVRRYWEATEALKCCGIVRPSPRGGWPSP
ncbi:hypothetical protein PG990_010603 [Apiospora arundinis]